MPSPARSPYQFASSATSAEPSPREDFQLPLVRTEEVIDGLLRQLLDSFLQLRGQMASLREENTALERHLWGPSHIFSGDLGIEEDCSDSGRDDSGKSTCLPVNHRERKEQCSVIAGADGPQEDVSDNFRLSGRTDENKGISVNGAGDGECHDEPGEQPDCHAMKPVWEQGLGSRYISEMTIEAASQALEWPSEHLDEEVGPCSRFISSPKSTKRAIWDLLGGSLIFYDLVGIPLRAFSPPENAFTRGFDWFVMIYWTLNVVMSLQVGYTDNGFVVMNPRKIVIKYLQTWFALDVLVLVPDWFFTLKDMQSGSVDGGGGAVKLLRVLRLAKCLRLLRAAKLKSIAQSLTDRVDSEYTGVVLHIIKMSSLLLLVNHYIATSWYIVGTADGVNSWVEAYNYNEEHWLTRYIVSFHWSITQFTPASKVNIQPVNLFERCYAVFVVIFALIGFSYIVGSITGSLAQLRAIAEDKDKQFHLLRRYLRQNGVSLPLRQRVSRFLEHAYKRTHLKLNAKKVPILDLLSDHLRSEVMLDIALPHMQVHPLLLQLKLSFTSTLKKIVLNCISEQTLAVGDTLFFPGDTATHMYLIESGRFNYVGGDGVVESATRWEDWLAEACLWLDRWLHVGTPCAVVNADVMLINAAKFADVPRMSPSAFDTIASYARAFVRWLKASPQNARSDVYQGEVMFREFAKSLMLDEDDILKVTSNHTNFLSIFS